MYYNLHQECNSCRDTIAGLTEPFVPSTAITQSSAALKHRHKAGNYIAYKVLYIHSA